MKRGNHNWLMQLDKHLHYAGNLTVSGKEIPNRNINVPDDIIEILRLAFPNYGKAVFFDLETTGLDPVQDLITQISAVCIDLSGRMLKTFDTYVRLPDGRKVPENIVSLTGITDELLRKAGKSEGEALRIFGERIGDGRIILVGHNIQFDLCFLLEGLKRQKGICTGAQRIIEKADYLDTLTVFRDRRPSPHTLAASLKAYEMDYRNNHNALEDAGGTLALTYFMECENMDLASYINRFGISPKYDLTGCKIEKVQYYRQEGVTVSKETEPLRKGKAL